MTQLAIMLHLASWVVLGIVAVALLQIRHERKMVEAACARLEQLLTKAAQG